MQVYEPHILPAREPFLHYLPSFVAAGKEGGRRLFLRTKTVLRAQPIEVLVFVAATAFFVVSFFLFLFSIPAHRAAAETIAPKASAPAVVMGVPTVLEMHIANNGLVLLRSARVVAISGSTLTVSTTWGSTDFTWVVNTNSSSFEAHSFGTRFFNYDGKATSVNGIKVGDLVTITGMLDPEAENPTLQADSVRRVRN